MQHRTDHPETLPNDLDAAARIRSVAALLVVCGAAYAGEILSDPRPSAAVLVADGVVAVAACLGVPWLLRRPVSGAGVLVGLSALIPPVTPVAATAVLLVARRRPLPIAVAAGGAGIAAQLARGLLRPLDSVGFGWWTVIVVAGYAAVVGWGAWMQAHRALVRSLEERARTAEEEQAQRVEQARRNERTRIAREMHDVLAHRLSLLATAAGAVSFRPDAPAADLERAAEMIRSSAHLALDDLREILDVLRSEPNGDGRALDLERPQPTWDDLPALVAECRNAGASVRVDDRSTGSVPPVTGRTMYRVVQEALTNARKHAPAEPVRIEVDGHAGSTLSVVVTNSLAADGDGDADPSGGGLGLIGIAERVELAGGSFHAGRTTAGEHRVAVSLPWAE